MANILSYFLNIYQRFNIEIKPMKNGTLRPMIDKEIIRNRHSIYNEHGFGIKAIIKHITYTQYGEEIYERFYLDGIFRDLNMDIHNKFKKDVYHGIVVFRTESEITDMINYILKYLADEYRRYT